MLGSCLHLLKTSRAPHGAPHLSTPTPSTPPARHLGSRLPSKHTPIATTRSQASHTTLRSKTHTTAHPRPSSSRSYASKANQADLRGNKQESKEEKQAKLAKHRKDNLLLGQFFSGDQKVGETVVVKNAELEEDEYELDPMPDDIRMELVEEQRLRRIEEERLGVTSEDYQSSRGLASFKTGDRKATLKPAKTVALQKLREKGNVDLQDLVDLDYEGLKEFALEHELQVSDFFTKQKTPLGELSELTMSLEGDGWEETLDDGWEGPIEKSKAYLLAQKHNPKNFRDRIRVRCTAGSGGKGGVSFYRDTRVHRGPPDGGDGGAGGSVIFIAAANKKPSLASLKPSYRATSGSPGSGTRRTGKSGTDVVIEVPLGTTIMEFRSKPKDEDDSDAPDSSEPSVAESFIPSNPKHARNQPSAIEAPSLSFEGATDEELDAMTYEQRLDSIEKTHRSRFSDPREGRPWSDPNLPDKHPMKESAKQFHKMMETYTDAEGQEAIPKPVFSFGQPGQSQRPGDTKMERRHTIVAPGMEDYFDPQEEEMFMDDEENGLLKESLSGAELFEKYRLQPPSAKDENAGMSNKPRTVELDEAGAYFVAAKGGAGGLGNFRLGAVRNRPQAVGTPGKVGESYMYQLELKLIADVGLVGFPNAGKSTFLSNVSRANPKIASYPFTTLSPEIGTVQLEDFQQFTIADLPGLIEGAHANRGLGHQFLKHIERTSALIYLIDMSGGDNRDPWKSFLTLWDELERYQPGLAKKDSIIVANKMDAGPVSHENLKIFSKKLKGEKEFRKLKIYPISAASKMNLVPVISALTGLLGISTKAPTAGKKLKDTLHKRSSGLVTMRIGSHFSEAMRNIK